MGNKNSVASGEDNEMEVVQSSQGRISEGAEFADELQTFASGEDNELDVVHSSQGRISEGAEFADELPSVAFGDVQFPFIDSPDAEDGEPALELQTNCIPRIEDIVEYLGSYGIFTDTSYSMASIVERVIQVCSRLKDELADHSNGERNEFRQFIEDTEKNILRSLENLDTHERPLVFLILFIFHQEVKDMRTYSGEWFRSKPYLNVILDATSEFISRFMEHLGPDEKSAKSLLDSLDGIILCSNIVWKRKNRTINELDSSNLVSMKSQSIRLILFLLALILQGGKDKFWRNIVETRDLKEDLSMRYEGRVETVKESVSRFNESLRDFAPKELLSLRDSSILNLILQVIRSGVDCIEDDLEQLNGDTDANGDAGFDGVIKEIQSLRVFCSCSFNYFKVGEYCTQNCEDFFADCKCISVLKPCLSEDNDESSSYASVHIINRRVDLCNSLLLYMKHNRERYYECLVEEEINYGAIQWNEVEGELWAPPWWNFWKHLSNKNINFLFYEEEKKRMEEVRECCVNQCRLLDYVARPLDTLGAFRTVEGIARGEHYADVLAICSVSLKYESRDFELLKANYKQIAVMCFSTFLLLLDVFTDCYAAIRHLVDGNVLYACLTVLFVMAPLFFDMAYMFYMKIQQIRGKLDVKINWKHVLYTEQMKLLHRSLKSILYAVKSRKEYSDDIIKLYSEIVHLRYKKGTEMHITGDWMRQQKYLIPASCYSRMVWNEKSLFDLKSSECINESAPQLLLQLTIAMMKLLNSEHVGPMSYVGIATSLASFALGMHLYRYQLHYGFNSLINDFKLKYRLMDTSVNLCIYCARFVAISAMISTCGWWVLAFAVPHIGLLYFYVCCCRKKKWDYGVTFKYKTTRYWPIHWLFTIPFVWNLWECESWHHFLFHLETFLMSISLFFLIPSDHPIAGLRWMLPCGILFISCICLPLLLILNYYLHPPCDFCRGI